MGASSEAKEDMDLDLDDDEFLESSSIHDLDEESLRRFCKKAAMSFFNEYGLISHQINSYNDFIKNSLQKIFDSFGEIVVEPGYDPSKKREREREGVAICFSYLVV
jgi:DNA-directed RNA polymerase-4/5 subunit 2